MKFFPHEKLSIETTRTKEEIMRTVWFYTQPKEPLPTSKLKKRKPFYGTVSEDHFEIIPWIYYINSFLPVIYGQVMQKEKGSY